MSDSRSGNVSPVSAENQRAIAASYAAVRRKTFAARRRLVPSPRMPSFAFSSAATAA